jgi:hypothetical protein
MKKNCNASRWISLTIASVIGLGIFALQASSAQAQECGDHYDCEPWAPTPSVEIDVTNYHAANLDGTGATVAETVERVIITGSYVQVPSSPTIDFVVVDPSTYPWAEDVAALGGKSSAGDLSTTIAAMVPIVLSPTNSAANTNAIIKAVTEINKIQNLQLRLAAMNNLIRSVTAWSTMGYPVSAAAYATMQGALRTIDVLARLGVTTGAAAGSVGAANAVGLSTLARLNLVALAGTAGYLLGGQIYDNSSWLQEGGLDPLFCGISRVFNKNAICP